MSPAPAKKTLYIDVDEEITGIIDKVRSADESILALVLPKRATTLQSIVNMKLLKRAATQTDKKVVLITSEAALMPIAGAAGLFVAANQQSRPYIPSMPGEDAPALPFAPEADSTDSSDSSDAYDSSASVSKLMNRKNTPKDSSSEPIEIDNTPKEEPDLKAAAAAAAPAKAKKDKSKKVPSFQKFRILLFVGLAAIILLGMGGYYALAIAPKATVTLRTESSETSVTADFTADTGASDVDTAQSVIPARLKESKKTESEKVTATGEQDNGTKATGTVGLRNCSDNKVSIPAGTGISNGAYTFITQDAVQLSDGNFDSSDNCKQSGSHTGTVNVIAQKNGDAYNLSPRTYTVSGFSSVVAQGAQMTGGTSKIVKVVSATDVEAAKKKITDKQNAVVDEIKASLKTEGYIGLIDTFSAGTPTFAAAPAVGAESPDVTVSGDVTYSMLGVKDSDLKDIVKDQAKDKVDTTKQSILSYGFDDADYIVGTKTAKKASVNLKTKLVAGPEINQDELKTQLAGKKRADAENTLKSRPGVTDVSVKLSPFWVSKVPAKTEKINFNVQQANGTPITP